MCCGRPRSRKPTLAAAMSVASDDTHIDSYARTCPVVCVRVRVRVRVRVCVCLCVCVLKLVISYALVIW